MRRMIALWLVLLAVFLSGCQGRGEAAAPGENEYNIYYLDSGSMKLAAEPYEAAATEMEGLIRELLGQLDVVPETSDYQTAMVAQVKSFVKENQVLYLYFGRDYAAAKADREILCRAALVRTLTQIEGIDYISIYCEDQPLMDSRGTPVGMMAASDFLDGISDVNAYERVELKLYFADGTGNKLAAEERELMHNVNTSMERLVVEALISGPETYGCYTTLPPDVKLLNVSVSDNTCYLNFDSGFLKNVSGVGEYIPIYSIVDSLTELTNVKKVQIVVNGSSDVLYRDRISLAEPFERNADYIAGGNDH